MTQTTQQKVTGSWLRRAIVASLLLHASVGGVAQITIGQRSGKPETTLIDIEMAPPPPKAEALPEEVAAPDEPDTLAAQTPGTTANSANQHEPNEPKEPGFAPIDAPLDAPPADASLDAAPDARPDARPKPDARPTPDAPPFDAAPFDAPLDASPDAMAVAIATPDASGNAGSGSAIAAATGSGSAAGAGSGTTAGSGEGSGSAAIAANGSGSANGSGDGSGSGSAIAMTGSGKTVTPPPSDTTTIAGGSATGSGSGTENQPAVDGAPTTAGTAANLLAYFPKGHTVAALIRFDRLRGTRWQNVAERLFAPMPDYGVLFGNQDAKISERFDMLVISTPAPRDATATTLVGKTALSRAALRAFLEQPATPVKWSVAKGGLLGVRSGTNKAANDQRAFLSPKPNWFLLAQPGDLGGLMAAAAGALDTAAIPAKNKTWVGKIQSIEAESGTDKRGPALVVTIALPPQRIEIPDIGVGVASVPAPSRFTLAMELTKTGWLLRGNMKFATEAEATEFADAVTAVQARIAGNRILQRVLKNSHVQNAINGLSVNRTAERVSYATSISIADAEGGLAYAAMAVESYYGKPR